VAFVPFHEIRDRDGKFAHLKITTPAQFVSHVFGNVLRPSLFSIESDNADRILILARKQILNNGF
jgi:hypothetical protein